MPAESGEKSGGVSWIRAFKRKTGLLMFGLTKVPMIAFVNPSVLEVTEERTVVRIPLGYRTKNHLNSMYFGALAVGADIAGGLAAMNEIQKRGGRMSFVFKDLKAEFLKRAEGDVVFSCEQGRQIRALVDRAEKSGQRENETVQVIAKVPSLSEEPVACFELTLSVRKVDKKIV